MSDLRGPLVVALEDAAHHLALGDYGDPSVGFLVLLDPDKPPAFVAITDTGTAVPFHQLAAADTSDPEVNPPRSHRFFTWADVRNAEQAFDWLTWAVSGWRYAKERERAAGLGAFVVGRVRLFWDNSRQRAMEQAMAEAAHAFRNSAQCPYCKGRYTPRGLSMHLTRSRYCSRRHAEAEAAL